MLLPSHRRPAAVALHHPEAAGSLRPVAAEVVGAAESRHPEVAEAGAEVFPPEGEEARCHSWGRH